MSDNDNQADFSQFARRHPSSGGRLFGALFLIGLGIAVFLDNIGILSFRDIWRFWPVYFLAVGVAKSSTGRSQQDRGWGVFLIVIGSVFLGWNFGIFHFRGHPFSWIVGMALLGFGIKSLLTVLHPSGPAWNNHTAAPMFTTEPVVSSVAIFGSCKRRLANAVFSGGNAQAIFGEVKYDFRRASIAPGTAAVVDVQCIFGAVKFRVPYNWRISMQAQGAFGSVEDKTVLDPRMLEAGPLLVITGSYLFGAIEIEN